MRMSMTMNGSFGRRKNLLVGCCILVCLAARSQAQTKTGQLTVAANVQSSISLIFNDNPAVGTNGFCPLTNAGTNNVGLDFGSASYTTGDTLSCVQFFQFFGFYIVSSSFDVLVTKANTTSPNYQLAAMISTTPPGGVFWAVGLTALTTTFTTLSNTNNYGQPLTQTLSVVVNQTLPAQTLFETITFRATAN
jgi:hypothetical protein